MSDEVIKLVFPIHIGINRARTPARGRDYSVPYTHRDKLFACEQKWIIGKVSFILNSAKQAFCKIPTWWVLIDAIPFLKSLKTHFLTTVFLQLDI